MISKPSKACRICAYVLAVAVTGAPAHRLAAQIPGVPAAQASPPPTPSDPLGRTSPRGTIGGLTSAVHRAEFVAAVAYLQLSPRQRSDAEILARNVTALLDRYFSVPITSLSASSSGATNDGLPLDREQIPLAIEGRLVEIGLVRVTDPQAGAVWLISTETLDAVPTLRLSLEGTWIERTMPRSLVGRIVLGLSLAQWLVLFASIALPLALFRLLTSVIVRTIRRTLGVTSARQLFDSWTAALRSPLTAVFTVAVHAALLPLLGFALSFRLRYGRYVIAAAVIVCAWLIWRVLTISLMHAGLLARRHGRSSTQSLILLADRIVKALIVLVTMFALLTVAGVDTTTALAGLGIGGVAIALGAQKSIENLLGAVFLLTDQALAVGDMCSINGRVGWIEDITLRSVRLRTQEQSLLSIPAGVLSQASIENFATRNKTLMQHTLRVRYGTTSTQLQTIVARVRALLNSHPQIETETARFRLIEFGSHAIELELFAYVKTAEFPTFLLVRESVLLDVAGIVETAGSGFARPTEFLQVAPEHARVAS